MYLLWIVKSINQVYAGANWSLAARNYYIIITITTIISIIITVSIIISFLIITLVLLSFLVSSILITITTFISVISIPINPKP